MEALARNDHLKIRELQIRYSTRRTDRRTSPSQRPKSVFDTDTPATSALSDVEVPYANVEGDNEALVNHFLRIYIMCLINLVLSE